MPGIEHVLIYLSIWQYHQTFKHIEFKKIWLHQSENQSSIFFYLIIKIEPWLNLVRFAPKNYFLNSQTVEMLGALLHKQTTADSSLTGRCFVRFLSGFSKAQKTMEPQGLVLGFESSWWWAEKVENVVYEGGVLVDFGFPNSVFAMKMVDLM